jgi:hypothetical protein
MANIDRKALAQTWIHSHEEDTDSETVFRPSTYAFPPSRGRKSFQLKTDGSLVSSGPGPDDRSVKTEGQWLMSGGKLELKPSAGRPASVLQVLSAGPDKLVVKKD